MPVEQVGRLLRRWQDTGGVLSRARVIADGMRLLSSLTADERRVLARALAEQGAPDLAARLETTSGGRIDAGDLHRTAEGLLALDRDQIDHLAATLSDRDQRLRLAHEAATCGVAQLPDAGDPPHPPPTPGGAPPPPPPPVGSRLDAPPLASGHPTRRYPTEALHALANGAVPLDDPELGDQMLDHPGLGEVQLTEVGLQQVDLADVGLAEVGLAENVRGTHLGDIEEVGRPAASGTGSGGSLAAAAGGLTAAAGGLAASSAAASVRTAGPGDTTGPGDTAPGDTPGPGRRSEHESGGRGHGETREDAVAGGHGAAPAERRASDVARTVPSPDAEAGGDVDGHGHIDGDDHAADDGPASHEHTDGNQHTDGDGPAGGSGHTDGRGHRDPPQTPSELVFLDHLGETPAVDPAAGDELVDRLRRAGSAHQRFAIVHPDRVGAIGAAASLRVLDAVPEGWQRRRVAERLGAAGALRGVGSSELLGRFPRDSDAAFVAGAALDDGSLSLDDLEGAVPDRLLRRLTIRARTRRRSEP